MTQKQVSAAFAKLKQTADVLHSSLADLAANMEEHFDDGSDGWKEGEAGEAWMEAVTQLQEWAEAVEEIASGSLKLL